MMKLRQWIWGSLLILCLGMIGSPVSYGAELEKSISEGMDAEEITPSGVDLRAITESGVTIGETELNSLTVSGITMPSIEMKYLTQSGLTLQGIQVEGVPYRLTMGTTYQGIVGKIPTQAALDYEKWWGSSASTTSGVIEVRYDAQIVGIKLGEAEVHVSASAMGIAYEAMKNVMIVPNVSNALILTQSGMRGEYIYPNDCKVYAIDVPAEGGIFDFQTTDSGVGLYGVLYDENLNMIDRQENTWEPGMLHFKHNLVGGRYYMAIGTSQPYESSFFYLIFKEEIKPVTTSGISLMLENKEVYGLSNGGVTFVEMPVYLNGVPNEGLAGYQMEIQYNPYELEFRGVTSGAIGYSLELDSYLMTPGSIRLAATNWNISQGAIVANGELVKLLFDVKAGNNEFWTYINVNEYGRNLFIDRNVNEIPYTTSGGSIHFRRLRYGDVNEDGRIDSQDVYNIRAHITGANTLYGEKIQAADVNGDGWVNIKDAVLVQQYVENIIWIFPIES